MVILSAGIRSLLGKPRSGPESGQQRHLSPGRIHHGMGGRHHLGTVGGIISEWRAASFRNRGRLRPESASLPVNHQLKVFFILVSAHNDLFDGGAEDHLLKCRGTVVALPDSSKVIAHRTYSDSLFRR